MTIIFTDFSNSAGQVVGSFIVIAIINYLSLFIIFLEILFAYILVNKTIGVMRKLWSLDLEARGLVLSHLNNIVEDLVSVRSLCIENYMI